MNKKILKSLVSVFVATLMLTSSFAVFAADGIISPWNTTYDFDAATFTWDGTEATAWNKWISTFTQIVPYNGCPAAVRDSYVDAEGNKVYDSVTKVPGDKYMYFSPKMTTVDETTGEETTTIATSRTGYVYFNPVAYNNTTKVSTFKGMNGGLSYGRVVYEFDIRIDELTANDYDGGSVVFYTSNNGSRVTFTSFKLRHGNAGTWYISYPLYDADGVRKKDENGKDAYGSPKAFTCGDWIRFKVTIDPINDEWYLSFNPVSKVTGSDSESNSFGPLNLSATAKGLPAGTNISIDTPKYCAFSVDNMSVTKETFVVDETKTTITPDGTNVNANVTIGNSVYAYNNQQFGDAVNTTSPVAILAVYSKDDGSLIEVDFKSVEYEDKHAVSNDTDKEKYFKAAPEYKNISLSVKKPGVEYEAKVMVWNNMTKMVPYIASYPAPAAE